MTNYYSQSYTSSNLGDTTSVIVAAPTPTPAAQSGSIEPPTGWVFAGILLILLGMMLYQSIKRFVLKILKKDQPSNTRRR
jgi:hypothetical protein